MPGLEFVIDEAAVADLLRNPRGLVAQGALAEVGRTVSRRARSIAPVDTGRLYDSIGWNIGSDAAGLYVDVSAIWYDRFLEKPARQIPRARRTLRNALRATPKIMVI